ncbi:MAG: cation transporter [Bacteroidales bacterium]
MASNDQQIDLPLEGVDSEHCALIVDNGLSKVNGIDSHRVELNNRRAVIHTRNNETITEAVKTIRDLGYDVTTIRESFSVLEMTCTSCAVSVESILKSQTGIVDAVVNFATATVSVEFIPELVHPDDMRKAVQSIGYDLLTDDNTSGQETIESIHHMNNNKNMKPGYELISASFMRTN